MILRNTLLQRHTTEHLVLNPLVSTHTAKTNQPEDRTKARTYFNKLLDAIREDGRVTLRASASKDLDTGTDLIRIVVADDGRGISAETLPKILEPFFTTKGLIGNGLGLWVSKQIIEKHGGSIQIRSRTKGQHQGTTFAAPQSGSDRWNLSSLISCGRCLTESESTETMHGSRANLTTRALAERLIA